MTIAAVFAVVRLITYLTGQPLTILTIILAGLIGVIFIFFIATAIAISLAFIVNAIKPQLFT